MANELQIGYFNVSPTSGNGDETVSVSASTHTGRTARSTVLKVQSEGLSTKNVTVLQQGAQQFVSASSSSVTAAQTATSIQVTGRSNAAKLTFSLGESGDYSSAWLTLPANYTAAGSTTANGASIVGDPGQAQDYSWSIVLTFSQNLSTEIKLGQLIVTDDKGNKAYCEIRQSASAAFLRLTGIDATGATQQIPAAGGSVSFGIEANVPWTIS